MYICYVSFIRTVIGHIDAESTYVELTHFYEGIVASVIICSLFKNSIEGSRCVVLTLSLRWRPLCTNREECQC